MKLLLHALLLTPFATFSQTIHPVNVGGSNLGELPPFLDPQNLVIATGDIVRWSNTSGTHNVNGSTVFFATNPESFGNGEVSNGDWIWSWTFTIPGTYTYQCDSEGHAETQTGTIIVESGMGTRDPRDTRLLPLFPSPATDHVMVDLGLDKIARLEVLSIDGRTVFSTARTSERLIRVPLTEVASGTYMARTTSVDGAQRTARFIKK